MESIDERAARAGLSLARLARSSSVSYHRIWSAARLTPDELYRVEVALQTAEQKKTAAGATRAAVREVGGASASLDTTP